MSKYVNVVKVKVKPSLRSKYIKLVKARPKFKDPRQMNLPLILEFRARFLRILLEDKLLLVIAHILQRAQAPLEAWQLTILWWVLKVSPMKAKEEAILIAKIQMRMASVSNGTIYSTWMALDKVRLPIFHKISEWHSNRPKRLQPANRCKASD